MVLTRYIWLLIALPIVIGCGRPDIDQAAPTPVPTPRPAGVANLLRAASPQASASVVLDVYATDISRTGIPGGPIVSDPAEQRCPDVRWSFRLTDEPFPIILHYVSTTSANPPAESAPWLIPAVHERDGYNALPMLTPPYHARVRGHLADPAFAQCAHAERIFTLERVITVYEQEQPDPYADARLPANYAVWPRHHNAEAGYSLPYPPDWHVEQTDALTLTLRSPEWADYPVLVRVYGGEIHPNQANPATNPPLFQGNGYGPFAQKGMFGIGNVENQCLSGYMVEYPRQPKTRSISVIIPANGSTYELALRYPIGLDGNQALLTVFSAIAVGFRLDRPPAGLPCRPFEINTAPPAPLPGTEIPSDGAPPAPALTAAPTSQQPTLRQHGVLFHLSHIQRYAASSNHPLV